MDYCIFTEPQQGASYETLLGVANAAERHGFAGFFRSDHYLKMGDGSGHPGPTHAWVTLAGLARETSKIRLGTLVSPITFHDPGPLAIMVAQVDAMSGGRIDVGVGSGWYQAEHSAYGLPFGALRDRMDRYEEALGHLVGLWTTPLGETYSSSGGAWEFVDSPGLPKPVQTPHPPIILGGRGPKRTPALAARYASEFNLPFVPEAEAPAVLRRVRDACEAHGRDPATLRTSAALVVCAGENDREVSRRADAIGRHVDELKESGLAGSPDEILTKVRRYADLGISRIYLQILDLADLDHVAFLGERVLRT